MSAIWSMLSVCYFPPSLTPHSKTHILSAFRQWLWHLVWLFHLKIATFSLKRKQTICWWVFSLEWKKNQIKNEYDNFITFYDVYRGKNPTHTHERADENKCGQFCFPSLQQICVYTFFLNDEKRTSVAYMDSIVSLLTHTKLFQWNI